MFHSVLPVFVLKQRIEKPCKNSLLSDPEKNLFFQSPVSAIFWTNRRRRWRHQRAKKYFGNFFRIFYSVSLVFFLFSRNFPLFLFLSPLLSSPSSLTSLSPLSSPLVGTQRNREGEKGRRRRFRRQCRLSRPPPPPLDPSREKRTKTWNLLLKLSIPIFGILLGWQTFALGVAIKHVDRAESSKVYTGNANATTKLLSFQMVNPLRGLSPFLLPPTDIGSDSERQPRHHPVQVQKGGEENSTTSTGRTPLAKFSQ